jgi:hypothetical protein
MGFGPFILISLFYAVIGVRVVAQVVQRRRELFDHRFTQADRSLVDQAAFFILVPFSVALHELGHAVAIWLFGSRVVDFGFYLFAGFVSYPGGLAPWKEILIALAGSLVNVLLSGAAIVVVFLKKPPLRASYNELLLQFALLSGFNALILYPVFDVAGGIGGDWSQIYDGGVPALSAAIFVCHIAILGLVWWGWKSVRVMRQVNRLTDVPVGAERGILGGLRPARPELAAGAGTPAAPSTESRLLDEAGARVASGWPTPVKRAVRQGPDGALLTLVWQSAAEVRGVVTRAADGGPIEIFGTIPVRAAPGATQVPLHPRQRLARFDGLPSADDLTIALRLAMEEVARWQPVAA